MIVMVDVRCPMCSRYICSVPEGTPLRINCIKCGIRVEMRVKLPA